MNNGKSKIFKDVLMSGTMLTLVLFLFRFLGFLYMDSYLSYFNVSISFYSYNFLTDFGSIILVFLIFLLPVVEAILVIFIFNHFLKIHNKKAWLKNLTKKNQIFLGIIFIILLMFPLLNIKVFDIYNISHSLNWMLFYIVLILGSFFKYLFNKIELEYDLLDFIMIIIILLTFYHYFVDFTVNFAHEMATQRVQFMMVGEDYVALYNTNDYAIVSMYEYNEEDNTIYILNGKTKKISLENLEITHKNFNSVSLESNKKN